MSSSTKLGCSLRAARRPLAPSSASTSRTPGRRVSRNTLALHIAEAMQGHVVELDEALQQDTAGIELVRQPAFGKVNLHGRGAQRQAGTDLRLALVHEIGNELVARLAWQV